MSSLATILCVDDEVLSLKIRKLVLEGAGYTVLTATTSDAALALFEMNNVDLVITDHILPGLCGTELAQKMKKLKPSVPIALLTGLPDPPEGAAHADCVIVKGEEPPAILKKIAEILSLKPKSKGASAK
jgi:CheY-like chemotaxis protein